jgi:hypothetical protein
MKRLPKRIIRIDDGMEFLLNGATEKYYVHLGIPRLDEGDHLRMEYSFEHLMSRPDLFKIADGTEDIPAMKKKWCDEMTRLTQENRGHGDDDDGC